VWLRGDALRRRAARGPWGHVGAAHSARVAKHMWLMLLSEYEPENPDARKALGYQ